MQEDSKRKTVRWHQAFYAGMQIELNEDADRLEFAQELILGNEPVRLDMLVIKNEDDMPTSKSIGQIFRKYNILEYMSPGDSLSIDDFYKSFGYLYLYKAITGNVDEVQITEMTLTFVCSRYPRKLIGHLKSVRKYCVEEKEPGIYLVSGAIIPVQIVLTKALLRSNYFWLTSLSDDLDNFQEIEEILKSYEPHKSDTKYRTVMDAIVKANWKKFTEVHKTMCDALEELMKEELDQRAAEGRTEGKAESILELLSDLGEVPLQLSNRIMKEDNAEILSKWLRLAAKAESVEAFEKQIGDL